MTDTALSPEAPAPEWARVEILGHRTRYGLVQEAERFGAKLLRVDVYRPAADQPCLTEYYAGSSLFSYSPCTEDVARAWADRQYDLPKEARLALPGPADEDLTDAEYQEGDHVGF